MNVFTTGLSIASQARGILDWRRPARTMGILGCQCSSPGDLFDRYVLTTDDVEAAATFIERFGA